MTSHFASSPRRVLKRGVLLLCAGLVAGFISCRSERAGWAEADAGALNGLSTAAVQACAGRPNAKRRSGTEWIYVAGDDQPGFGGRPPRFCEARVRFAGDKVTDVRYSGATGALSGAGAECAPIFARC